MERILARPLIFDGAMGTMIYQRGVFLNACYDELCLTQPKLIAGVHQEYLDAGADVLETNTFGANRIKLAAYGLADRVEAINREAVKLARQVAGDQAFVAASVGPCLPETGLLDNANAGEIEDAFAEQLGVLASAGIDLVSLETFRDLAQLQLAARVAKRFGLTVLASYTLNPAAPASASGSPRPETLAGRALDADAHVDIVGLNCGLGPADLFVPLRHLLAATRKPVVVMPNAGGPREVGGRMLYLNSPEYFTEFAKRFIELGARGVGGCCGTTPAHIRMAARAIQGVSGVKAFATLATGAVATATGPATPAVEQVPVARKSPLGVKLAAGKRVTSVELLPPQSGAGLEGFLAKCRQCEEAGIDAINLPDGPRASARMCVMATAFAMQKALAIEPIPHYCCRDRNLIGMQSDLLGGCALGLKTWLFITGDPPKLGNYPDATGVFDLDAIGLSQLATNLNHGFDAAGQPIGKPTAMLIGVGANPVAVEMEREVERYFRKIEAGAEYAITQPIFDPEALLRFIERVSKYHKTIPIIAGLYPLLSFRNADFMNQHVPGVVVPAAILERMSRRKTKEDGIQEGIAIAREIRDRVADAVAGFQTSAPLGRTDIALSVLS